MSTDDKMHSSVHGSDNESDTVNPRKKLRLRVRSNDESIEIVVIFRFSNEDDYFTEFLVPNIHLMIIQNLLNISLYFSTFSSYYNDYWKNRCAEQFLILNEKLLPFSRNQSKQIYLNKCIFLYIFVIPHICDLIT